MQEFTYRRAPDNAPGLDAVREDGTSFYVSTFSKEAGAGTSQVYLEVSREGITVSVWYSKAQFEALVKELTDLKEKFI